MPPVKTVSALALWELQEKPLKWVVEKLIPEGAIIFAGRPKAGKSYVTLGLALAIAGDYKALEHFATLHSSVLYLALEDGERRIKRRLKEVWDQQEPPPASLYFSFNWPRGKQAVTELRAYLTVNTNVKTVIIDTLAMVRDLTHKAGYEEDYATIQAYQGLAQELERTIIIVTHTRKPKQSADGIPGDPLDEVQNTSGLTGAADAVLVMKRARGSSKATLNVISRDIDECEYVLKTQPGSRRWTVDQPETDDLDKGLPQKQRTIRAFLREKGGEVPLLEIIDHCKIPYFQIAKMLSRMVEYGLILRPAKGIYALPEQEVSSESNGQMEPYQSPF